MPLSIVAKKQPEDEIKRARLSQTVVPRVTLEDALAIPKAIYEQFGGDTTDPLSLAQAVGQSPQSSAWRYLTGAAEAYGLTIGAYNAKGIGLTELGRAAVAAIDDGTDAGPHLRAAMSKPSALSKFLRKYDGKLFPRDDIASHVLVSECGIPRERALEALRVVLENARHGGVLVEIKGKQYVKMDGVRFDDQKVEQQDEEKEPKSPELVDADAAEETPAASSEARRRTIPSIRPTESLPVNARVFISHGKKRNLIDQIKEIVLYGKLEPVVSIEKETPSIPVPEKVLEDMRSCFAGIIHVASDETIVGEDNKPRKKINDNVLIEIGAAMALYKRNFILLVEDGLEVPSNLQGLYQCRYTGDSLDGVATMKLLKAFNQFDVSNG